MDVFHGPGVSSLVDKHRGTMLGRAAVWSGRGVDHMSAFRYFLSG